MSRLLSITVLFISISLLSLSPLAATKKIAQLEFRDISVSDALRILSDQSGLNVVASKAAAKVKMTLYLKDIAPMDVLEAMAKTYNLWYQKDPRSGVVRVYTVDEFRLGKVDYKNEQTKIYTFKHERNALDFAYIIQDLYGYNRVRLSPGADESEIISDLSDRLARYNLIAKNTVNMGGGQSINMGVSTGSSGGGNRNGSRSSNRNGNRSRNGNRNGTRQGNSNTQTINSNDIVDSNKMLPDSETEALLTGRFEGAEHSMSRLIERLSPIYVTRIKRQNRVLIRTRDRKVLSEIDHLYKQVNTELSTVLMEVKLLQIDLSDGYNSLFDFKLKNNGHAALTEGQNAMAALNNTLTAAASAFNPALLSTYVSKRFEARLQLLEKEGRVTEVATPILLTANQEVSRVFIGEERPIITSYSTASLEATNQGNGTNIFNPILTPITSLQSIGTTLLLTPNINQDKSVSLRILIEQSTLSPTKATIPIPLGGVIQDAKIDIIQKKTFSGTIIARHGSAIAVGGLIEDKASDVENKVPVLGDIPVLGFFFREQAKLRKRTELVVIIRPYITTNPVDTAKFSQQYIREHSLHPVSHDIEEMGIYSNPSHTQKGYRLEQPFKEYDLQDPFEDSDSKNGFIESFTHDASLGPAQKNYIDLIEYAARAIRQSPDKRKHHRTIKPVPLNGIPQVDLLYDARLKTIPVASWHKGGVHVTAIAVYNLSDSPLTVDYKHIKGRWLTSSIEKSHLKSLGAMSDSTYLYVISDQPYREIINQIRNNPKL